jgi:hypothetical protein
VSIEIRRLLLPRTYCVYYEITSVLPILGGGVTMRTVSYQRKEGRSLQNTCFSPCTPAYMITDKNMHVAAAYKRLYYVVRVLLRASENTSF